MSVPDPSAEASEASEAEVVDKQPERVLRRVPSWSAAAVSNVIAGLALCLALVGLYRAERAAAAAAEETKARVEWEKKEAAKRAERERLVDARLQAQEAREAVQLLDRAWDLLGGRPFAKHITEYTSDRVRIEDAATLVREATVICGESRRTTSMRAHVLTALGEYGEALKLLAEAEKRYPQDAAIPAQQGFLLNRIGMHKEAIETHERAIKLNPDYHLCYENLALSQDRLGRTEEAVATCRRLIEVAPDYSDGHSDLGGFLNKMGHFEEALDTLEHGISVDPAFVDMHLNRGVSLASLQRYEDAIAAYDRALELDPNYVTAHSNRGRALGNLGRLEEAREAFDAALAIDPNYQEAIGGRAMAFELLSEDDAGSENK